LPPRQLVYEHTELCFFGDEYMFVATSVRILVGMSDGSVFGVQWYTGSLSGNQLPWVFSKTQ